jgi:ferritin-like metal-binding protein YciE
MQLETLEDLYIHELKDLYSAEQQLIRALFKMAEAAENKQLEAGFSGASGTDQRACRSSRKVLS